jgi:hypothetical protein
MKFRFLRHVAHIIVTIAGDGIKSKLNSVCCPSVHNALTYNEKTLRYTKIILLAVLFGSEKLGF